MTDVAKIIEIVGSSDNSWEEAAQIAVDEAKRRYMEYIELKSRM